ncbi:hypothetical protein LPH52_04830 [Xylella taiwanensis]|uniref:Uncharacterized protein n=2 Tax=Xylella taiwanensis TaxID=1444770 RepID=A0ABS8TYF6_9GAMM|nr:contractile injection system protein, VgrG/Pvc8 family [Xylella taiwanensis]MCD8456171.1 hypothetical protein [Xylella taiwanensis]MCD8463225.1 hypothetical protein [Xylella taiwanensis]MCD8465218.1 hypothetical protein [Xylella taiwanensis]MCD8470441.1 hypothetical protein [Xylella taiwanensis]MCD8473514.1 hypothetical protein [Xylella taiwanensis]
MTLRAHAAPWEGTPQGNSDLQTPKTRSWPAGTTLGTMLSIMAAEHGMESAISHSLSGVTLPHTDQTEESDINVLVRLARRYAAIAKPGRGRLMFAKRGESKTACELLNIWRNQIRLLLAVDGPAPALRRGSIGSMKSCRVSWSTRLDAREQLLSAAHSDFFERPHGSSGRSRPS